MIAWPTINTLTLIFVAILVVGVLAAGFGLVGVLRRFTPGRQARPGGADDGRLLANSALSLGVLAAVFGLAGLLLTRVAGRGPGESVVWALGLGLAAGLLAQFVLLLLDRRRRPAVDEPGAELVGRVCRVVIAIPSNGLGEVACDERTDTVNLGARSTSGDPIPRGARVVVERVSNRVAVVREAE